MSLSGNLNGIDMNKAANLELFSQILLLKNDRSRDELVFMERSNAEQRTLQAIAHSQELVYEYSASDKRVRISRPVSEAPSMATDPEATAPNFLDSTDMTDYSLLELGYQDGYAALGIDTQLHPEMMTRFGIDSGKTTMNFQDGAYDAKAVTLPATVAEDTLMMPDFLSPWTTAKNSSPEEETPSAIDPASTLNASGETFTDWADAPDYYYQSCKICGSFIQECTCLVSDQFRHDPVSEVLCPDGVRFSLPVPFPVAYVTSRIASSPNAAEIGPYQCDLCPWSYFRADHITRHRKTHHIGAGKKYYCSHCPSSFDVQLAFNFHRSCCGPSKADESPQSIRGVNDSRRGSVHSGASNGYEEYVFDSRSAHSGSQASIGSASSVGSCRRGPLSRLARAGMKAVKEVGACWRCKFLKKSCDTNSPCALCPKGNKAKWESVGCKRGNFHVPSFRLCRRPFARLCKVPPDIEAVESKIMSLNIASEPESWTQMDSPHTSTAVSDQIESDEVKVRRQFYGNLNDSAIAERSPTASAQLLPLKQCALSILWNFIQCPTARQIFNENGSLDDLVRLLPFAIAYQAERQEDQLIAQSLICLRTCAEALRAKAAGLLGEHWHSSCDPQNCKIECLGNLSMHLRLYIEELSRVFFKKENVQRRGPWFLSTFYSFCIQSYVRRVLVDLVRDIHQTAGAGVDICTAYEEAIWQVGQRDEATVDAPIQLETAYALFCHGIQQKDYLGKDSTLFERAAQRWKGLSLIKREWSLRQALLLSVTYLNDKLSKYPQARNPLKSSLSEFGSVIKHTRLSAEMIAELLPNVTNVTIRAEADHYLYTPVRLFIALNSGTLDPICGLFDRHWIFYPDVTQGHIDGVCIAVAQSSWEANGIRSSSDYLKSLFQDDDRSLDQLYTMKGSDSKNESNLHPSDANREGRCSVCMNHVHAGEDIAVLSCSHWFHEKCVVSWLRETNTCPSC